MTEEQTTTSTTNQVQQGSLGELFFKYRDYTPLPLIALLIVFCQVSVASAVLGMLLVFGGELIRIYSVAFIGSISRTRKNRTGGKLIQEGPFGYVRNPLYVGNFFITMGVAVFGGNLWVMAIAAVMFSVQYYYIVQYEENLLLETFGDEYVAFCNQVPAWFPAKKLNLESLEWPDNFSPAIKSETKTLMTIAALILILTLRA